MLKHLSTSQYLFLMTQVRSILITSVIMEIFTQEIKHETREECICLYLLTSVG